MTYTNKEVLSLATPKREREKSTFSDYFLFRIFFLRNVRFEISPVFLPALQSKNFLLGAEKNYLLWCLDLAEVRLKRRKYFAFGKDMLINEWKFAQQWCNRYWGANGMFTVSSNRDNEALHFLKHLSYLIAEKSKRCSCLSFNGARAYVRGLGRFWPVRLVDWTSGSI